MVSNDRDQASFCQGECSYDTQGMLRKNTNGENIRASQEVIKPRVKALKVL